MSQNTQQQGIDTFDSMRALWSGWDPIGVFRWANSESVQDEYDEYVRECLRLMEKGEITQDAMVKYLETVVVGSIGMTKAVFNGLDPAEFAKKIMANNKKKQ